MSYFVDNSTHVAVRLGFAALALGVATGARAGHIEGRIVGHDGVPLERADVDVFRPVVGEVFVTQRTNPDGTFSLDVDLDGMAVLRLAGVGHEPVELPIPVDPAAQLRVDVRLATYTPADLQDVPRLATRGTHNGYNSMNAAPLYRADDGTYFGTFPVAADSCAYQVVGAVVGHTVQGTVADRYRYDGGGDYLSVVATPDSLVRILFDPKDLPKSESAPVIHVEGADPGTVVLASLYSDMDRRKMNFISAGQSLGDEGVADLRAEFAHAWPEARALADEESDPFLLRARTLNALQLLRLSPAVSDEAFIARARRRLPPDDPMWTLAPELLWFVMNDGVNPANYESRRDLAWAAFRTHPDPQVRRYAALQAMTLADDMDHREDVRAFYAALEAAYPNSAEMKRARHHMQLLGEVSFGPVPSFELPSLADSTVIFTPEAFAGRVLLLDFWATWCAPCVAEMPELHEAYDAYHDLGFDILSVSFDKNEMAITRFRLAQWPMPWNHAFVEDGFQSEIAARFGIRSIPSPVLVDRRGEVVAGGVQLRGEGLLDRLSRLLGTNERAPNSPR